MQYIYNYKQENVLTPVLALVDFSLSRPNARVTLQFIAERPHAYITEMNHQEWRKIWRLVWTKRKGGKKGKKEKKTL